MGHGKPASYISAVDKKRYFVLLLLHAIFVYNTCVTVISEGHSSSNVHHSLHHSMQNLGLMSDLSCSISCSLSQIIEQRKLYQRKTLQPRVGQGQYPNNIMTL